MAFKIRDSQPDFNRLKVSLLNSKTQTENNALYQTINGLIDSLRQSRDLLTGDITNITGDISSINNSITTINNTINILLGALASLTYITVDDESADLPNSRQLLAGLGITFDDTVANQRTINSNPTAAGYWTLLTDGNVDETDFIFAGGEAISLFVPV